MEESRPVEEGTPPKRRSFRWIAFLCLIALLAGGVFWGTPRLLYALRHVSTDDAVVDGTLVPVAAEVGGRIVSVAVEDDRYVRRGDVLVEIASEDYAAALREKWADYSKERADIATFEAEESEKRRSLEEARHALLAAEADAVLASTDLARERPLAASGVVPKSRLDEVRTRATMAAERARAAAEAVERLRVAIEGSVAKQERQRFAADETFAAFERASIDLARTVVRAPVSGFVAQRSAEAGKFVSRGQPLLVVVADERARVVANFKETDLARVRAGASVDIYVDAYPGVLFRGHVESVQSGTGAIFSLLPPENATGNFVKVVQRVPVHIIVDSPPDPAHPLLPGLSVVPYVDVDP